MQAFAADGRRVLGPIEVDSRSHETPALLDVKGRMGYRRRDACPAGDLVGGAGVIKGNQRVLHEDMKQHLYDPSDDGTCFCHQEVDESHGRVETRTASITHDLGAPARTARLAGSSQQWEGSWRSGVRRAERHRGDPVTT